MEKYLVLERPLYDGHQKIYFFENGYGASVVNHSYSCGTELAVIQGNINDWRICCRKLILDDDDDGILGYLTKSEVEKYLKRIKEL
jgi:hypothetical protein